MKQVYRFHPQARMQAYVWGGGLLVAALLCLLALLGVIQCGVYNLQGAARMMALIVVPLVIGVGLLMAIRSGIASVMRGQWLARTTMEVDQVGLTLCETGTFELHDWDQVRLVWMHGKLSAVQVAGCMIWINEVEDPEGFARNVGTLKEKGK